MKVKSGHKSALILLIFIVYILPAKAGEINTSQGVKTNLECLQYLYGKITAEFIERSKIGSSDSIDLICAQGEDSWIARDAVESALKARGCTVFSRKDTLGSAKMLMDAAGFEMKIRYEDPFREGIIGANKSRRVATASVALRLTMRNTQELLFTQSMKEEFADTVRVDDIPGLELPSARSTHGELPSGSFIDRVIEPFVIIGATGVVVYLFFHVRT